MPRNSSGTYTLPSAAFVAGTTIVSAAVNLDFSDIATALTQSLATTGVTTMTGPVKAASGSAAAPGYTFGAALTTGFYLAGTNQIGWAAAGVAAATFNSDKSVNWFGAGTWTGAGTFQSTLNVTGVATFTAQSVHTNGLTSGGQILTANGTSALPAHSFSGDPDTGLYSIAANQLGIATNGTLGLSINPDQSVGVQQFAVFNQISAPVSASASTVRLYAKTGTTRLAVKDINGVETLLGPGELEEISSQSISSTTTNVDFTLTKTYSTVIVVLTSVSVSNSGGTGAIKARISSDGGSSFGTGDWLGINITSAGGITTFSATTADAPVILSTGFSSGDGGILQFFCMDKNISKQFRQQNGSDSSSRSAWTAGKVIGVSACNFVRITTSGFGAFTGGLFTLYGTPAT